MATSGQGAGVGGLRKDTRPRAAPAGEPAPAASTQWEPPARGLVSWRRCSRPPGPCSPSQTFTEGRARSQLREVHSGISRPRAKHADPAGGARRRGRRRRHPSPCSNRDSFRTLPGLEIFQKCSVVATFQHFLMRGADPGAVSWVFGVDQALEDEQPDVREEPRFSVERRLVWVVCPGVGSAAFSCSMWPHR